MSNFWRSLEEKNNESSDSYPNHGDFKEREFQKDASVLEEGVGRRSFIKLLGASTALAGLTGCNIRKPYVKIRPYARKVEHVIPGRPLYYATALNRGEDVVGLLAETHEGRPTKLEGNPTYSGSLGGSSSFDQAAVLNLYDPDKLKTFMLNSKNTTDKEFLDTFIFPKKKMFRQSKGEGLFVLLKSRVSPTLERILGKLKRVYPKMKVFRYNSVNNDEQLYALKEVTGKYVVPDYHFDRSNVILSFDADFLSPSFNHLSNVNRFSKRRDPDKKMNRLYMFESRLTPTGMSADHRYPAKRANLILIAQQLFKLVCLKLNIDSTKYVTFKGDDIFDEPFVKQKDLEIIANDLIKNSPNSLIVAGNGVGEKMHQLAFAFNEILGANRNIVDYHYHQHNGQSFLKDSNLDSLKNLASQIKLSNPDTLFILGGDPVYDSPVDIDLKKLFVKVANRVHLTEQYNETSLFCNWVVPKKHFLEEWNDLKSFKNEVCFTQPVINKMVPCFSEIEMLHLLGFNFKSDYSLVRDTWKVGLTSAQFENKWKQFIHNGVVKLRRKKTMAYANNIINIINENQNVNKTEVCFYLDYSVYDGSYVNNGWLQELPDPVTKLTWDNAALVSPRFAHENKLKTGHTIEIQLDHSKIDVPVFVCPGHAYKSIGLILGYGKNINGKIGKNVGYNAGSIRYSKKFHTAIVSKPILRKKMPSYIFATTQDHGSMEGRPQIRYADQEYYQKHPDFAQHMVEVPHHKSLWKEHAFDEGYQWGMAIDLSKCVSCNACVVACQAENNIPIVGKEEVLKGREMHWNRIDRYFEGDEDNPKVLEQGVSCIHCENAPCEQVCPVAATVHDEEGLNVMVYNRCVGTRYCADNCPVKVRRFNFFDYHQRNPHSQKKDRFHFFDYMKEPADSLKNQFNPDVTVRMRGVMEKCTYCIQRISAARIDAKNENRLIKDGEVITACQQACPSDGIVFGNILDPKSKVSKWKKKKRDYTLLEQLLLKPRTSYLAKITNPNSELVAFKSEKESNYAG